MSTRAFAGWVAGALFVCALLRAPLLTRQGLWVDEVFSLALATGHSLEHPAAEADPAQGDFVEGAAAPASAWRAALAHEDPPASLERVVRAVFLSDTNPPLYYVALHYWTRLFGTSDAALRGYSLACALACVPFLLALARWVGGPGALLPATALFACAPISLYYGTEGRMYAQLWLATLALAWWSTRTRRWHLPAVLVWSALSAFGFLTHYFFAFAWGPLALFTLKRARGAARARLVAGGVLLGLVLFPWYARVGESLARWRVTQDWLTVKPDDFAWPKAALELVLGFFSGSSEVLWGEYGNARLAALLLVALVFGLFLWRARARTWTSRRALPWLWLGGSCAGPLVFDALRGTYATAVPRYALAGLPAAFLLAAVAWSSLRSRPRVFLLLLLLAAWAPHAKLVLQRVSRSWNPLRETAEALSRQGSASELVVVHSIPSGVLGIARYYEGPAPIAAWVEQLGNRTVPASFQELAHEHTGVTLVRAHEVGAPCPLEDWLAEHARSTGEAKRESVRWRRFAPTDGERF